MNFQTTPYKRTEKTSLQFDMQAYKDNEALVNDPEFGEIAKNNMKILKKLIER